MAAITIKNMDVTYNKGKSYVIKDMNLEIKDGEFCVFLGPSGCGKSTAMYCIAGLLHPVHGEICFGNEAMNQLDERGKEFRSIEFATWKEKKMHTVNKRLVFIIGGPYGFSPDVYAAAQEKISLSKMTFSHQMIRLIFVEQLYRAFTILNNGPYHHE